MGNTLHLLHVDDDDDDRYFLSHTIRESALPIALNALSDGQEVIPSLNVTGVMPDVTLLDIKMSKMSGLDVLAALKRGKYREIPVIMLTSSPLPSDIARARELGAQAYCVKPASALQLKDFVNRLYNSWQNKELISDWPRI